MARTGIRRLVAQIKAIETRRFDPVPRAGGKLGKSGLTWAVPYPAIHWSHCVQSLYRYLLIFWYVIKEPEPQNPELGFGNSSHPYGC